ncbi:MAG: nucleotidyltransferase family protein [Eubacterium sp.]|nr:nucleotidyltransferase family protein [Eubacterium sp.]
MKTVGVIAEFNPFHNGHGYFLREVREQSGADYIVAVMSGDFVQRGTPAVFNKYIRTEMALAGGADLVCELPPAASCGSAERFATGAISLLESMGCIRELWFGSECGNADLLTRCAGLLLEEPEQFRTVLKEELKKGLTFPAARSKAAEEYLKDKKVSSILSMPNNILGIEYIKALQKAGSFIRPCTLQRLGSAYSDTEVREGSLPSAAAIRTQILTLPATDYSSLKEWLPARSFEVLHSRGKSCPPITENDFSDMLIYRLLREDSDTLTSYLDINPDLARRICNLRSQFLSFSTFADLVKTRNIARSAVNRALLHILLGIKSEEASALDKPSYIRILGFRRESSPLLTLLADTSRVQLVTRTSDLEHNPALRHTHTEHFAYDLYETIRAKKAGEAFLAEASRPLVLL